MEEPVLRAAGGIAERAEEPTRLSAADRIPQAYDWRTEARRLQGCLNDMVGIIALSALASGRAPAFIMGALLDGLIKLQRLEFASLKLGVPIDGAPPELVRCGARNATPEEMRSEIRTATFRLGIGEEIGVLQAGSARRDFPTPTEFLVLQVAASQAAIGLQEARRLHEQARAARELEHRVAERTAELSAVKEELAADLAAMTHLHELDSRLLAKRSLHDLLLEVLDGTIALQNADFGTLQLYDQKTQALELLAQCGFDAGFAASFRYVDRDTPSACGRSLRDRMRVVVEDVYSDPAFAALRPRAAAAGFRAVQATPLFGSSGEILGMLSTQFRVPHRPSERELRLTDLYARLAAELVEHKQAETALLATQDQLAHVARVAALGELASSIAHEVNQPLAGVVINGHACLRWLSGQPPDFGEVRAATERIVRDANRASEVVAGIRAFVRRGGARRAPLDVRDAIEDVVVLIRDKALHEEVKLEVMAPRGMLVVMADGVQLQQVLLNLAINAIEAMRSIETRPRVLRFSARMEPPDAVLIAVCDSGVGLAPSDRERAFEAFHTTKPDGMGMGLAISRSIVMAHGGRLWATPSDGGGETFQFTLPMAPNGA